MTLVDWIAETRARFDDHSPWLAAKISVNELSRGAQRRLPSLYRWGTPVWEREPWDVLVVLDACRVDALRTVARGDDFEWLPEPSAIESMWSVGSTSREWLGRTFRPAYRDRVEDTAYVTANPHSAEGVPVEPDHLLELWRRAFDAPVPTIPPEPLTDAAIRCWRERDERRIDSLVVHYMQPHAPFRSRPDWTEEGSTFVDDRDGRGYFEMLRAGDIEHDELWDAYLDNLKWGLESVSTLVENVDGRLAITADHGNGFGEWGVYGHPFGSPAPAVKRVPWVVVEATDERTREPDAVTETEGDEVAVTDRLADLGYL